MNRFLRGMARAVAETFDLPGPILEIGSHQVPGLEDLIDLRGLFPGREYHGLDMRPGPGVDLVGNVEDLPFPDASVGTVLALSTFEHVADFQRGFDEVRRVLRPDGVLFVSTPFYFHVHAYPDDYWRFTPSAIERILNPYACTMLGMHGEATRPLDVWALAFREGRAPITEEQHACFRILMRRYAREPLPWLRRLRYLLGRAIAGRRPFAPWLDRNRWTTRLIHHDVKGGSTGDSARRPEAASSRACRDRDGLGVHRQLELS